MALVEFTGGALKVTCRDQLIGWQAEQRAERLRYVLNNARFVILPGYNVPNQGCGCCAASATTVGRSMAIPC